MKYNVSLFLICLAMSLLVDAEVYAQRNILPQGIGVYQFGHRQLVPQKTRYNAEGEKQALGAPFAAKFDGPSMLEGSGGAELKELAHNLAKLSSFTDTNDSLLNDIQLGQMDVEASGKVSAQAFGLGYGLKNYLSLFLLVPYVSVEVNAKLNYAGSNNAREIQSKLGNTAPSALKDGLTKASNISAQMIKDGIEAQGYQPIDRWTHRGVGDIQVGTILGGDFRLLDPLRHMITLKTTLSLPTGYVEKPEILTDVSVGTGHYSIGNEVASHWVYNKMFWLGGVAGYQYNFASQRYKRVPEGTESLVGAERTALVEYYPGAEMNAGVRAGYNLSIFKFMYEVGQRKRGEDEYRGGLPGNYNTLTRNSNSGKEVTYHRADFRIQTIDLFQKSKFPLPLQLTFSAYRMIEAKNSPMDDSYYEVSLASLFRNPFAASKAKPSKAKNRVRRSKNKKDKKNFAGNRRSKARSHRNIDR